MNVIDITTDDEKELKSDSLNLLACHSSTDREAVVIYTSLRGAALVRGLRLKTSARAILQKAWLSKLGSGDVKDVAVMTNADRQVQLEKQPGAMESVRAVADNDGITARSVVQWVCGPWQSVTVQSAMLAEKNYVSFAASIPRMPVWQVNVVDGSDTPIGEAQHHLVAFLQQRCPHRTILTNCSVSYGGSRADLKLMQTLVYHTRKLTVLDLTDAVSRISPDGALFVVVAQKATVDYFRIPAHSLASLSPKLVRSAKVRRIVVTEFSKDHVATVLSMFNIAIECSLQIATCCDSYGYDQGAHAAMRSKSKFADVVWPI